MKYCCHIEWLNGSIAKYYSNKYLDVKELYDNLVSTSQQLGKHIFESAKIVNLETNKCLYSKKCNVIDEGQIIIDGF